MSAEQKAPPDPWWLQFPAVKSTPERRDVAYLEELIRRSSETTHGVDFAVIDVRGTDRTGSQVKDSIPYRAQDFYPQIDAFGERFKAVPEVFFYCGSSNGRGPRVAGWYQDWLNTYGITSSKALVLNGGIKAWVERYGTDQSLTREVEEVAASEPTK
ncbi:hypothetical protein JB92DRAFT_3045571 [Gautieria morchelliformis]|nr:hypothetical protein JB92DRAFT_3045571 [Gautieria morchelliformis]